LAFAFGLAAASFFPAIFLGIFDKRANMRRHLRAHVVGIRPFTAGYIIYFKFVNPTAGADQWLVADLARGHRLRRHAAQLRRDLCVSHLTRRRRSTSSTWWRTSACRAAPGSHPPLTEAA